MPFQKKKAETNSDEKLLGLHIKYVQITLDNMYLSKAHNTSVKEMQSVIYKALCQAFPELAIPFANFKLETNQVFKDFIRSRIAQRIPAVPIPSQISNTVEDKILQILP